MKEFDLLKTVEYGGCSAKLSASLLEKALANLPKTPHPNLLVDIETHDDAGVYKLTDELAIIQTTDFFSPVCSDPFEFGQIAAANALSDVYAMGGQVLCALNIVAFPADAPLEALSEILRGGIEKVIEAGGVMMGGHTIVDDVPKYGLAVTGTIHPEKIISNSKAREGDSLILTKSIGGGVVMAGHRIGEAPDSQLRVVLESMKKLNKEAVSLMHKYGVRCATDITGFGLAGHSLKMAMASNISLVIETDKIPFFDGALFLLEMGCIPGAAFRNLDYVEPFCSFDKSLSYERKILAMDAQTSGGLLICCQDDLAPSLVQELKENHFPDSAIIGRVEKMADNNLVVR